MDHVTLWHSHDLVPDHANDDVMAQMTLWHSYDIIAVHDGYKMYVIAHA